MILLALVLAFAHGTDDLGDGLLPADERVVLVAVVDGLDVIVGVPDGHELVVLGLGLRVPVSIVLHPGLPPVHLTDPDGVGDEGTERGDEAVDVTTPPRLAGNAGLEAMFEGVLETGHALLEGRCAGFPELEDVVVGAADGETEDDAVLLGLELGADGLDHLQPGFQDDEDVAAAVQNLLDFVFTRPKKFGRDVVCGWEHGQLVTFRNLGVVGTLIQDLDLPLPGRFLLETIGAVGSEAPEAVTFATTDAVDGLVGPLMSPEGPAGGLLDLLLVTASDSGGKCFVGGRYGLADSLDGLFPGGERSGGHGFLVHGVLMLLNSRKAGAGKAAPAMSIIII